MLLVVLIVRDAFLKLLKVFVSSVTECGGNGVAAETYTIPFQITIFGNF